MILYDILDTAQYFQKFTIYITNAYDQNLCIGRGTRAEMLDEAKNCSSVFDHLLDKVEYWCVSKCTENQIVVFIRDEYYGERVEKRFSQSDKWGTDVNSRPYRYSIETEEYTDEYLNKVYA